MKGLWIHAAPIDKRVQMISEYSSHVVGVSLQQYRLNHSIRYSMNRSGSLLPNANACFLSLTGSVSHSPS